MKRYEQLNKQLDELIESIGDGENVDNESCHQAEDEIKDLFIHSVNQGLLDLDQLEKMSNRLDNEIVDYTKWYA